MKKLFLPVAGLCIAVLVWSGIIHWLSQTSWMASHFSPQNTLSALLELGSGPDLWIHILLSLQRVALGLLFALLLGIPLGLLVGSVAWFSRMTSAVFQFLRMISPLSWMPLAIMVLGIGEAPVVFLLACSAVWPIVLNVASGVLAMDPQWRTLADSLGANRWERLSRITVPAIAAHLLTGVRLAIGLIWVILVPAEMLGVSGGLGYLILDTRDRMAYGDLMAVILIIGLLGFLLDWVVRWAHRRWSGV